MLVFNVKSGLHSDVVSVKFSSGSAVQRCCFLLDVAQVFNAEMGRSGCLSVPPHPLRSLSLLSPLSFLSDTVGVAAFNVCVKTKTLNLDIKLTTR